MRKAASTDLNIRPKLLPREYILTIGRDKGNTTQLYRERSGEEIRFLVLHHTGGSGKFKEGEMIDINTVEKAIFTYQEYGVSAHYIIDTNGQIYQLVEDRYAAFHAGKSYWDAQQNINNSSIGIEFLNAAPMNNAYTKAQIGSGILLCKNIILSYRIPAFNVVGHSDIAPDRKDDPSHRFPWKELARNGIGFWFYSDNKDSFNRGIQLLDCDEQIKELRDKFAEFGYKIKTDSDQYDDEMQNVISVFNMKYNAVSLDQDEKGVLRKSAIIGNELAIITELVKLKSKEKLSILLSNSIK